VEAQGVTTGGGEGGFREVLLTFLKLGCTSFGGPIAHIGYFRAAFVDRLQWLSAERFASLLSLCQLLPGPASSQLGMAIGHVRCGWRGAIAAWIGFTAPSALLMLALAWGTNLLSAAAPVTHGLKLAAVAVVAQAVLLMARQFSADVARALIAFAAGGACLLMPSAWIQAGVIAGGAIAGLALLRAMRPSSAADPVQIGLRPAIMLLLFFGIVAIGFPLLAGLMNVPALDQAAVYVRSGALVFGGGHVVLPLLEHGVVATGAVGRDQFLAAYGAAQALPGPLFSIAAYPGFLGSPGGIMGALIALAAIFLPGALILFGVSPFWSTLASRSGTASALAGANAAVVGLLAAAFWDPLWISTVHDFADFGVALCAFAGLAVLRLPSLAIVLACVVAGAGKAVLA
jgi:chromate transporter